MEFLNLITYITWNPNPDIFVVPFINHPIKWYGVSWAVGFIVSQQIMFYIYKRDGRTVAEVETLTIYIIISAILGARLGHVIFYDPIYYLSEPLSILAVWEGGLASHGGVIGILIALYFFARKTNVKYLWIVDRMAIIGALTASLIRLGNLMNSEMVGIPTTLPWGFVFVQIDNIPRHPAQLYEAMYCFFLFVFLFSVWYKKRNEIYDGFLIGWFFIILFGLRFIDEFFKINQSPFEDELLLNMGQILSIPFILAGIAILLLNRNKSRKNNDFHHTVVRK